MSDDTQHVGPPAGGLTDAQRQTLRHHALVTALRIAAVIVLILATYAIMPVDLTNWSWAAIPLMVGGLIVFTAIFLRQLRRVSRDDFPVMRAVEALVFTVLLFLVLFAAIAVQLDAQQPGSYSEALDKVDGFYFAVTTLATVGYGDITPVTTTARVIGTVQMLGNLALLGVAVRAIGQAVDRGRESSHGRGRRADTDS